MRHLILEIFDYGGFEILRPVDLEAFHLALDFSRYVVELLLTPLHL